MSPYIIINTAAFTMYRPTVGVSLLQVSKTLTAPRHPGRSVGKYDIQGDVKMIASICLFYLLLGNLMVIIIMEFVRN